MIKAFSLLILAAMFSTCGNIVLKLSRAHSGAGPEVWMNLTHPVLLFCVAVGFYFLNLIAFARALDYIPVSVGYPLLASIGFLFLTVSSAVILQEKISILQIIGIVIIVIGISLLASGKGA